MATFTDIASLYRQKSLVQASAGAQLIELLGIGGNADILDVGCGTGKKELLSALPEGNNLTICIFQPDIRPIKYPLESGVKANRDQGGVWPVNIKHHFGIVEKRPPFQNKGKSFGTNLNLQRSGVLPELAPAISGNCLFGCLRNGHRAKVVFLKTLAYSPKR